MKSFRNAPCSAGSHGSLVVKNVKTFKYMFGSESKNKKSDHNIQKLMINSGYQSEKKDLYLTNRRKMY